MSEDVSSACDWPFTSRAGLRETPETPDRRGLREGAHRQRNAGKLQMRLGEVEAAGHRGAPLGHHGVEERLGGLRPD
jgi:hypothetical protein